MTATMEERITFNQLSADDFKDSQITRTHSMIRQLAAAMVTVPSVSAEAPQRAYLIARLAIFMTTGVQWDALAPQFLAALASYAQTALDTFAEDQEPVESTDDDRIAFLRSELYAYATGQITLMGGALRAYREEMGDLLERARERGCDGSHVGCLACREIRDRAARS